MRFEKPVIFFDGVCGLCNGFVNFILKHDDKNRFFFSPLQGKTAGKLFPGEKEDFRRWTIVCMDGENTHRACDAVITIFIKMGGKWRIAAVLSYIPKFIRDSIYGFVATNRYKWFGKTESCVLPTEENSGKFLP